MPAGFQTLAQATCTKMRWKRGVIINLCGMTVTLGEGGTNDLAGVPPVLPSVTEGGRELLNINWLRMWKDTDVLVEGQNLSKEAQLSRYISTVFFFNSKEFVFEPNQLHIKRI